MLFGSVLKQGMARVTATDTTDRLKKMFKKKVCIYIYMIYRYRYRYDI